MTSHVQKSNNVLKTFLQILKLIPFFIVAAIIILLWWDDFIGLLLAVYFHWITVPAIVLSIIFFIKGLRWRDKWQRAAVILGGADILLLVLYIFLQAPNQTCNPDIMAKHYDKHHAEMEELHSYLKSAVADSCSITLEFDGAKPSIFHVSRGDDMLYNWGDDACENKEKLMLGAGLSQDEFEGIRKRLKNMGCIGIKYSQSISDKLNIWFRRVGMGLYSYNIYSRPMTDEEKKDYMFYGEYIPYNDHCVFEYGGGAVGADEFGSSVKSDFLEHHQPW